jgi:hypothetical protein
MTNKLILIADPDREVLRQLGKALHDRGYVPPKKLVQILRSNPRTENIPVIVMGQEDLDESTVWGYREASIRKPFNTDEVLSLVASTFRKMATAQEVREEGREIEGSLSQISLVDLLQIFNLNRKNGLLELKTNGTDGRIFIQEGRVVHASIGKHRGEKAIFRLLEWREGSFAFIPEQVTGDLNIRRGTDVLLLDGARQADEMGRLRSELPAENVRLALVPELKARYEGLHPVTQEIINLLEFYTTVRELVDNSRVSDFEACRAISTLLDKGILKVMEEEISEPEEEAPLLEQDLLYELKVKLSWGQPARDRITRAKVCLLCPEEGSLKEFITGMRKLPGMELAGQLEALRRGFGHLGSLWLSENFMLSWMLLPIQPQLNPLWQPLGVGMVGGVVLQTGMDDQVLYRFNLLGQELSKGTGVPVVHLSPDKIQPERPDGVRRAVVQLLHRIAYGRQKS